MPYKDKAARQANEQRRRQDPKYVELVCLRANKVYAGIRKDGVRKALHLQRTREWRARNLEQARECARRSATKQRSEHPEKTLAHARKAQTTRMLRYPKWADDKKIQAVYAAAQALALLFDEPWHVDHDIPLQGRLVSGLHVHENLKVLRGVDNLRKSNKFEV